MPEVTILPGLTVYGAFTVPKPPDLPSPRATVRKSKTCPFTDAQVKEVLDFVWPVGPEVEECRIVIRNRTVFMRQRRSDYKSNARHRRKFYWDGWTHLGLAHTTGHPQSIDIWFPTDPERVRTALLRWRRKVWNNIKGALNYDSTGYLSFDPFRNPMELLVVLIAHELRHIYQFNHISSIDGHSWVDESPYHLPEKLHRVYGTSLDRNDRGTRAHDRMTDAAIHFYREHDADCYALGMLRKWRKAHPLPAPSMFFPEEGE